ncbi:hypothetical protein QZH41_005183 [Actinostola sp. cb2023]|nr:hypothetical protein QZH41_005183 [Actinostola sp. cb2023]
MAQVPVAPFPGQVDAIIADPQPEPAENANAVANDENQRPDILFCIGRPDGLYSDPRSCERFINCQSGMTYFKKCPDMTIFDPVHRYCYWRSKVKCVQKLSTDKRFCVNRADGSYADPMSCQTYITCNSGNATFGKCPDGMLFDPIDKWCDWLCNVEVKCGENPKPEILIEPESSPDPSMFCLTLPDGLYPDPSSCNRFIHCHQSGRTTFKRCPSWTLFNPAIKVCDWTRNVKCVPSAPRSITLIEINGTTVQMSWRTPIQYHKPLLHYIIRVKKIGSTNLSRFVVQPNARSHTLTGLLPGSKYVVEIMAVNKAGKGKAAVGTVTTPLNVPPAPINLSGKPLGATAISLSWKDPTLSNDSILMYIVTYGVANIAGLPIGKYSQRLRGYANTAVLKNLIPGEEYEIDVQALSFGGFGKPSTIKVTTESGGENCYKITPVPPLRYLGRQRELPWKTEGATLEDRGREDYLQWKTGEWGLPWKTGGATMEDRQYYYGLFSSLSSHSCSSSRCSSASGSPRKLMLKNYLGCLYNRYLGCLCDRYLGCLCDRYWGCLCDRYWGCLCDRYWGCLCDRYLGCLCDRYWGCLCDRYWGCLCDRYWGCLCDRYWGCLCDRYWGCLCDRYWGCLCDRYWGCPCDRYWGCLCDRYWGCLCDRYWGCLCDRYLGCLYNRYLGCLCDRYWGCLCDRYWVCLCDRYLGCLCDRYWGCLCDRYWGCLCDRYWGCLCDRYWGCLCDRYWGCLCDRYLSCLCDRYLSCLCDRYWGCLCDRYWGCLCDRYMGCLCDRYWGCLCDRYWSCLCDRYWGCLCDRYLGCLCDRYLGCLCDRYLGCLCDCYWGCLCDRYWGCLYDRYLGSLCDRYLGCLCDRYLGCLCDRYLGCLCDRYTFNRLSRGLPVG